MSELQLVKSDSFGKISCDFWTDENNDIFMSREQIGRALGYADPQKALDKIHERNADRLNKFSVTVRLGATDGKFYNTIVYSTKGVYEICRFSRQPVADAFMDWVWDVIETIRKSGGYYLAEKDKAYFVQSVVETVMKQLPELLSNQVSTLVLNTVNDALNTALIEDKAPEISEADAADIELWYKIIIEWRDYRSKKSQKSLSLVDKEYIELVKEKYPDFLISQRTLYRKWKLFKMRGKQGLIDGRGRHGNHHRRISSGNH